MTPQEVCGQLAPRPPGTAPILMNPHEEGGGNRLICQADQLTDTNAYIRTRAGLGQRYLLIRDVTLSGNFTPIGTSATPFQGVFNLGGKIITGLSVQASADSVTDRPIFGAYTPSPERFIGYPAVNAEDICDILTGITPTGTPILYNPHESNPSRLICQADQLSDTGAYIRTTTGLGERYLLVSDVTLSAAFTPIGASATPFQGVFNLGGKTITGLSIQASATSVTDRPIFGHYDASNADFTGYSAVNAEDICDILTGITPTGAPTLYNPHESNPSRLICQADQLSDTSAYIRTNLGKRYLLGKDITLSGNFTPIGNFTGNFDGGEHMISGLMISSANANVGFFGEIGLGGVVKNLNFQNPNVSFTGTVAANIGVLAGESSGGIKNVNVMGNTARVSGNTANTMSQAIGGLVGRQTSGTITNSTAMGNVSDGGGGDDPMGGLAGFAQGGTITNSTAMGNTSDGGGGDDPMGGLVGFAQGTITNSTAMGNVSDGGGGFDKMGGLVGRQGGGTIRNSIARGNISNGGNNNDRMAGLVGEQNAGTITGAIASGDVSMGGSGQDFMGGLVGDQAGGTIESSLSLGNVSGVGFGDFFGGLIALVNGTQTNLYWNTQTSGLMGSVGSGTCSGCTGRTTGGTNGLINATSLTGFNTPTSMPTAGPWDFGTTSQYPGLTFTSGDQTCTLRPVLTSAASTSTTTAAEFQICPDAVNADSFHPICRSKPTGCPN